MNMNERREYVEKQSGMTVDEFAAEAKKWLATAKDPRRNGPIQTSPTVPCRR
jgi:hypothetical protein